MDYTIFYRYSWMQGNHMFNLFKCIKLTTENEETSYDAFERTTGYDRNCIEYVIVGHPKIEEG